MGGLQRGVQGHAYRLVEAGGPLTQITGVGCFYMQTSTFVHDFSASLLEVLALHVMLNPATTNRAVAVYVDSWGVKRLSSLAMRRWRSPIGQLRDPLKNKNPKT